MRAIDIFKRLRGDDLVRHVAERQDQRAEQLERQLRAIEAQLAKLTERIPAPLRTSIDPTDWAERAQPGELKFHVRDTRFRGDDEVWLKVIDEDWRAAGFEPTGWQGKRIIDVGAGSRVRSLWFEGAEVVVLEPLAEQFEAEVPWNDYDKAFAVYSKPGEEFIPELEGTADLIVSINALDHGYDIAESFKNVRRYLKPDGRAFLSFDMHDEPDYMHPLVLDNDLVLKLYEEAGLIVEKFEPTRRYHGAKGPSAFHYWLRPA